jgi:zinc transporter ZupT
MMSGILFVVAYCIILLISCVGGWLSYSGGRYIEANIVYFLPVTVDVSTRIAVVSLLCSSGISRYCSVFLMIMQALTASIDVGYIVWNCLPSMFGIFPLKVCGSVRSAICRLFSFVFRF